MSMIPIAWYAIGLVGAFSAREAFQHDGLGRIPLTYGVLFWLLAFAAAGPATVGVSVISWVVCLSIRAGSSGFWKRPVFPRKDPA